jgi:hypothetical protein
MMVTLEKQKMTGTGGEEGDGDTSVAATGTAEAGCGGTRVRDVSPRIAFALDTSVSL